MGRVGAYTDRNMKGILKGQGRITARVDRQYTSRLRSHLVSLHE